jgi:hypothetical protein
MNFIILVLVGLFFIINYKIIKSQNLLHNQIVESLENQIASQLLKAEGFRNQDCCNHENLINFKLSIIKQQVLLLAAI